MLDKLQTSFVVTLIAVLVWLYAEGEAVSQHQIQLQVKFVPPPGRPLLVERDRTASNDAPMLVWMTFIGSSGQRSQVEQIVSEGALEIMVTDRPDAETPEQTVALRDALADSRLGNLGISIVNTTPDTVSLWVEPLVTEEIGVQVATGDLQLAQPPTPEPVKVNITVPARLADEAQNLKLIADLTREDLSQYEVNTQQTLPAVPLRLPQPLQRPGVVLERDTVAVTFTIRKQIDSVTLTAVPIHINAPPLVLEQYRIRLPEDQMVLPDVRLAGPADVIDRIRRKDVRVWAELRPSVDELDDGVQSLTAHLNVPPGVTLETPLPQIQVEVTRRQ